MAKDVRAVERKHAIPWRAAGWGIAAMVLLVPFVAMRFTDEVAWSVGDFIFAALLVGAVGLAFELAVRTRSSGWFRAGVGLALAAALLTIWINGAVGMIGSEDNGYNLLFLGVVLLALLGAAAARFHAPGMALAMAAAAAAQAAAAVGGMAADLRGGGEQPKRREGEAEKAAAFRMAMQVQAAGR